MLIVPTTIGDALVFVERHHRHGGAPHSYLFAIACAHDEKAEHVAGVAIVGRPVSRMMQDGWTAEVIRLCTDGSRNACSMLYGACWRAARAMGYTRLITYTLATESGASLRAAGLQLVGTTRGGTWNRTGRPRVDRHPTQGKLRWQKTA